MAVKFRRCSNTTIKERDQDISRNFYMIARYTCRAQRFSRLHCHVVGNNFPFQARNEQVSIAAPQIVARRYLVFFCTKGLVRFVGYRGKPDYCISSHACSSLKSA
jgi:hypothetical protein